MLVICFSLKGLWCVAGGSGAYIWRPITSANCTWLAAHGKVKGPWWKPDENLWDILISRLYLYQDDTNVRDKKAIKLKLKWPKLKLHLNHQMMVSMHRGHTFISLTVVQSSYDSFNTQSSYDSFNTDGSRVSIVIMSCIHFIDFMLRKSQQLTISIYQINFLKSQK